MASKEESNKPALFGSRYSKAEVSPGFLFWKVHQEWSRTLRDKLEIIDLTQVQYALLAATSYLGSSSEVVSQQDIAEQLSMDKMMVSDVSKTLVRKKLISRKPNPQDGRSWSLELTAEGRQKLKKAVPVVEETDEIFFGVLGLVERREFARALSQLVSGPSKKSGKLRHCCATPE